MWTINSILTAIFEVVYSLLGAIHPAVPLIVLSTVFGVGALVVIRYCSNQSAIARVKDKIKANMLAIWLFKDELRVMFGSFGRVILSALKLQMYMIPPLLVMLIPMVLVFSQMAARQEWSPLQVGEQSVILIRLKDGQPSSALDIKAEAPPDVTVDSRVRCVEAGEVAWNVRASRPGRYVLGFDVAGQTVTKELVVGQPLERVSPKRHNGGILDSLLYACEKPLSGDLPIQAITLDLPPVNSWFYGSTWWIVWFLILSIAIALIFKPVLKVNL
jgi:hypothetical protein